MIERKILKIVKKKLKDYPAVALLGPRQIGKTTLALSKIYYDLEQPEDQCTMVNFNKKDCITHKIS